MWVPSAIPLSKCQHSRWGVERRKKQTLCERGFEKEGGMPGREEEASQNRVRKNECGS